jgi:hypothetical protein
MTKSKKNKNKNYGHLIAEALAARSAIHLALELKLDKFIFKGDSTTIISAQGSTEPSFTSFGHLIAEAKVGVLPFQSFHFLHVRRNANYV